MKILTTGTRSGIGRFIHEHLGGFGMTRNTREDELEMLKKDGVDVIIHCAFNAGKDITSDSLYNYYHDNVLLTGDLVSIPHKKFIYFSTVDLYPNNGKVHTEEEMIYPDEAAGIYATAKLISEEIVKRNCADHLILRPTTLVGRYSRRNTLFRIMEGERDGLYLSGDSRFNYVLHTDILEFIKVSMERDISGIYNVASSGDMLLSEVALFLGREVVFGEHLYDVGRISNEKITSVLPAFQKTSQDVLGQFVEEYAHA